MACDVVKTNAPLNLNVIGPRSVIVPADPIEWSAETSYEYLTLVSSADFGQGYVAKRDVPSGTPLTNTEYWIPVASFNAQLAEIMRQLAEKASTSDLESIRDSLNEAISSLNDALTGKIEEIGTVNSIVDNEKGFVQDSTHAVMLPGVGGSSTIHTDPYGLAAILSSWGNNSGKLGYDNLNTFKYVNEDGQLKPYMPTEHMNNGYLPIDCATFVEMVANNIYYYNSPYYGTPTMYCQGMRLFDYTSEAVRKYWDYMVDSSPAGRMLTWQFAKYLYDRGLLTTGNISPKPGMIVFLGDTDRYPNHYMGIYHCAIVTNHLNFPNVDEETWVIDCGGISSSPTTNTLAERKLSSVDFSRIVAGYCISPYPMVQNVQDGFNYLINKSSWETTRGNGGVDNIFNTSGSPITFTYKSSFELDPDGTKGGLTFTTTLKQFRGIQVIRPGNKISITITSGKGLRISGGTMAGLSSLANEVVIEDA